MEGGGLELEDPKGVLRKFIDMANPAIRRHAVGFVGQLLEGFEPVDPEILRRFMALWDTYWQGPGRGDAEARATSALFGTWFSCGQFDNEWAITRLEQFQEVVPVPEPDHEVVERLSVIAEFDAVRSIRILDHLIRHDREGWRIQTWMEAAKTIIEKALRQQGETRQAAIQLIDLLGRRGYIDLGKALSAVIDETQVTSPRVLRALCVSVVLLFPSRL